MAIGDINVFAPHAADEYEMDIQQSIDS
jgi:hypothetical protein